MAEMTQKEMIELISVAVSKAVEKVALTPELIKELKAPYVDEVALARQKVHQKNMAEEIREGLKQQKAVMNACPHAHDGRTAISLVNNFPDGRVRGRCNMCHKLISPAHYEVYYGKPFVVPEDKEYNFVLQLDSSSVAGY